MHIWQLKIRSYTAVNRIVMISLFPPNLLTKDAATVTRRFYWARCRLQCANSNATLVTAEPYTDLTYFAIFLFPVYGLMISKQWHSVIKKETYIKFDVDNAAICYRLTIDAFAANEVAWQRDLVTLTVTFWHLNLLLVMLSTRPSTLNAPYRVVNYVRCEACIGRRVGKSVDTAQWRATFQFSFQTKLLNFVSFQARSVFSYGLHNHI